ncbi:MAG: DNA topoisomerase (ATP-hydrolyzing) subunit B [Patescibacteria group bacterium]
MSDNNNINNLPDNQAYDASKITVLEGLEAVRKRPGMYIGNTASQGLHHCVWEIMDNSIDEAMAGYATEVELIVLADGGIQVTDNGRGIPVDIHPKTGKTALETIMTVLHAGGKFGDGGYKVSGGLHGVGASVVNAVSSRLEVEVLKNGKIHELAFERGKTIGDMKVTELEEFKQVKSEQAAAADNSKLDHQGLTNSLYNNRTTGTTTRFWPDSQIFETVVFDIATIRTRLRQMAFLNKGILIRFIIEKTGKVQQYYFEEGIKSYLKDLTKNETLKTPIISFENSVDDVEVAVALAYSDSYNEEILAFTNGVVQPEGGMHLTGFRTGLTKTVNGYGIARNLFKEADKLSGEDMREGLRAIISIKMADPQFEGQTKGKLGSSHIRPIVDNALSQALGTFLEENPAVGQSIVEKCQLALKARLAARAARESVMRKGVLDGMALPGKLADCSSKVPAECEIFIVEGDSAGGSAKQGRDRKTQAILPLRGKVLNTERARLDKILAYDGIKNMLIAMGCGIGEQFDLEKLRYHKIVIMTDADVDGAHIATLLLTFFYRYLRPIIDAGYLYIARPPLYKLSMGKKLSYVYSDEEKAEVLKEWGFSEEEVQVLDDEIDELENAGGTEEATAEEIEAAVEAVAPTSSATKKKKPDIQRYKGLGEMSAQQLWETTMDPQSRVLYQVHVGDAELANRVFEELMGEDVTVRKQFINKNALYAELDLVA